MKQYLRKSSHVTKVEVSFFAWLNMVLMSVFLLFSPSFVKAETLEQYVSKAKGHAQYGDYSGAIKLYDAAIAMNTANGSLYVERGLVKQMSGDKKGALIDMDMAVILDSANVRALNCRGTVLMDIGNYKAAKADFDKALDLLPTYGNAYINRGKAKVALGDTASACVDFTNAMLYGKAKYGEELKRKYCVK